MQMKSQSRAVEDIRAYKRTLRQQFKDLRLQIEPQRKRHLDDAVFKKLTACGAYREASLILVYVSTPIEVDTRLLIEYSLQIGKFVAVPKCNTQNTTMDFYLINSLDDLEEGTYSVLEPRDGMCKKLKRFDNSVCIVPALAFDMQGYRLGYGKGYYDRFLGGYSGKRLGLCYSFCAVNELIHGYYDRPVDLLVTDKYIKSIQ